MLVGYCKALGRPLIIPADPPHTAEQSGKNNRKCGKWQHMNAGYISDASQVVNGICPKDCQSITPLDGRWTKSSIIHRTTKQL